MTKPVATLRHKPQLQGISRLQRQCRATVLLDVHLHILLPIHDQITVSISSALVSFVRRTS